MPPLPAIPVVDAKRVSAAWVAEHLAASMADILAVARRRYTPVGMAAGDRISRTWLARNRNPYLQEMNEVAWILGTPGTYLLNCSYEWACTTGTRPASGGGQMMVRVLDWDLGGLGRNLALVQQRGRAGDWLNLGWPGFVGCITGMAPGRFAAAINQPPPVQTGLGMLADWTVARPSIWNSRALPPAHLLRRAFDEADDYAEAAEMLAGTPVSTPTFYCLAGPCPGQGCVIERTPSSATIRQADPAVAVANHWTAASPRGYPCWQDSTDRQNAMTRLLQSGRNPLSMDWLRPPILNGGTRMAAIMDPAAGSLFLQGWEEAAPATQPLRLQA